MTAKKEFKVGDTVKVVAPEGKKEMVGLTGVVTTVDMDRVLVEFIDWTDGHAGNKADKSKSRWNFFSPGRQLLRIVSVAKTKAAAAPKKPDQSYKGNGKHAWEVVVPSSSSRSNVDRLRVPGGWIYKPRFSGGVFVPMPEVVKHKV